MPKKLPTSRVRVGDVLAEPVVHGEGQMLLAKGTPLDQDQIDMLLQRGVLLVTLVDDREDASARQSEERVPVSPEELKRIILEEARWFGDSRKDPVMAEVFRYVVERRSRGTVDA